MADSDPMRSRTCSIASRSLTSAAAGEPHRPRSDTDSWPDPDSPRKRTTSLKRVQPIRRNDSRATTSSRRNTTSSIASTKSSGSVSTGGSRRSHHNSFSARIRHALAFSIAGRVTVYSTTGCPEASHVFSKLEALGLPFIDINLDVFCERQEEMIELCGVSVTPQVLFNDRHLGGLDELQELEASGDLDTHIHYLRRTRPTSRTPALPTDCLLPAVQSNDLEVVPESVDQYASLVREIRKSGLIKDRTYHLRSYKACITGTDLVNFVCRLRDISRSEAVEIGQTLIKRHYLHHVCHDHFFKDEKLFYRFLEDEPTEALNTFMVCELEPRPAKVLAEIMRRKILSMYDLFLSPDGKAVDYEAMGRSEAFSQYSQLACELQRCDVATLDSRQRTAFFINIYNVLVMHATTQFDSPKTAWDRFKFFNSISYMIGGLEYSLSGIENGILRANKRAPNQVHRPFHKNDPRLQMCLPTCDPRVHFAIVCGARSCPPIKVYSAEELDEQLDVAVAAFLDDGGIDVDPDKHEIHLSRIFQWYQSDFAETKYELLKWIIKYMPPGDMCRKLFGIVRTLNYKIIFQTYDWSSNKSE
ncbi:uncharacterized protein LOC135807139 [Sycon ciliatum]|uniref:uncharacterized protein LOC135807139 n=1 Tax=Sycon ciliatum TaxID=27933 RepID=UPI0020AAB4B5|eukprot:scpid37365/ scgid34564/ Rap guanine nucleotide exchange factor 4; Exchange factor directly activated by cAMP 2; Exchange protein directly activated by cAMP 2; cAMP-regulated guanine nucleotide exchange factor II